MPPLVLLSIGGKESNRVPFHELVKTIVRSTKFLRRAEKTSSSITAYRCAIVRFATWLGRYHPEVVTIVQLEKALSSYACHLFRKDTRREQRQRFLYALYGMECFLPELHKVMRQARQAASGWNRIKPSKSPPPLSKSITFAIATVLLAKNETRAALAVALSFHGYLRAGEVCQLRGEHICLPDDPRLTSFSEKAQSGCLITQGKTGRDQFLPLDDEILLMCSERRDGGGPMFGLSYSQLNALFQKALNYLGLDDLGFTLHSLRHGGATTDWLGGMPFSELMLKGRWESEKSCKRYLNAGSDFCYRSISHKRKRSSFKHFRSAGRAPARGRLEEEKLLSQDAETFPSLGASLIPRSPRSGYFGHKTMGQLGHVVFEQDDAQEFIF